MIRRSKGGNKYKAKKVVVGDREFDSKKEAKRYEQLCEAERLGYIKGLQCQVYYELIPHIRKPSDGKYERAVAYIADFVYVETATGRTIVEDVKGYRDGAAYRIYTIKRKLMLWRFGIEVVEV